MKPADITYDMVLDALKKSAGWHIHTRDGAEHGFAIDAETLVLVVHGYEYAADYKTRDASRQAASAKLGWPANPRIDRPTPGQVTKVRGILNEIVERGLAERVSYGNGYGYRWLTPEILAAREVKKALEGHMQMLQRGFVDALPRDGGVKVETKLISRHMQRGVFDGFVTLTLDEQTANKVLAILQEQPICPHREEHEHVAPTNHAD